MPSDLSTLDLATLNAASEVIVAALQSHCIQWEQQSADAAADGNLTSALMFKQWAFAAELMASTASAEVTILFCQAVNARFGSIDPNKRSVEDQFHDALALEVASAQEEPVLVAA